MTVQWMQKREKSLLLTYLFKSTGANGIANKEKQELMDRRRTAVKSESDQPPPCKYKTRYPKWNISLICICHIDIEFITVAVTDMLVKDFSENLEEWRTWQQMSASALFQMDPHSLKLPNTKWSEKNQFQWQEFPKLRAGFVYGLIVSSVQIKISGFGKCLSLHWWILRVKTVLSTNSKLKDKN